MLIVVKNMTGKLLISIAEIEEAEVRFEGPNTYLSMIF